MKKNKKIITICASSAHYRQVLAIEKELKKLGFSVKIPGIAYVMQRTNDFDVSHYKTWYKEKADYKKKTALMKKHFRKVIAADVILVANFEKHGIKGYIGGNVLMEMTLAFYFKKPIYIYNDIVKELSIKEEVYGLQPVFIKQDLQVI